MTLGLTVAGVMKRKGCPWTNVIVESEVYGSLRKPKHARRCTSVRRIKSTIGHDGGVERVWLAGEKQAGHAA